MSTRTQPKLPRFCGTAIDCLGTWNRINSSPLLSYCGFTKTDRSRQFSSIKLFLVPTFSRIPYAAKFFNCFGSTGTSR